MEERIKAVEEVVQYLCKEVDEMKDVFRMHIRSHMAEYNPVHVISMEGKSNGISYTWGSYYRTAINKKEVQPNQSV